MTQEIESKGPLTALLLADMADQIADHLADFSGELNIYGIQYENDSVIMGAYSKILVRLAARIRAEDNRNKVATAVAKLEGRE